MLHGVDFEVNPGEVVVILGANGAGKTTTLRAICQMIDTKGRVDLDGTIARRQLAPPTSCGGAWPTCPRAGARSPSCRVEDNLEVGAYVRKDKDDRAPTSTGGSTCSRAWASGARSWPAASAAASSRCWPSPGR